MGLSTSGKCLDVIKIPVIETLVIEEDKTHNLVLEKQSLVQILETPEIQLLTTAVEGPQGPKGDPGGIVSGQVTIAPGVTGLVDTTTNLGNYWSFTIVDTVTNNVKTCRVHGNKSGSYTTYAINGSLIPFKVSFSGTQISIKNNHLNSILVKFIRT